MECVAIQILRHKIVKNNKTNAFRKMKFINELKNDWYDSYKKYQNNFTLVRMWRQTPRYDIFG